MNRFLILALAVVCACFASAEGQMTNPLFGQGIPPKEPVDVYVSVLLEKLISVDETSYRFTAQFVLYLSWQDDRALDTALRSTALYRNGTRDCIKPCYSDVPIRTDQTRTFDEYLCCDDVFLPTLTPANVFELPEGRLEPYTIYLDKGPGGGVGWKIGLQAVFFTPMYFGNYPFDSQTLLMQFIYTHGKGTTVARFIPSATSTSWYQRKVSGKSDVAAGWNVLGMSISTHNTSLVDSAHEYTNTYGQGSHESDPLPISPKVKTKTIISSRVMMEFDIQIHIKRHWLSHVMTIVVPILLLIVMTFTTYFISPSEFDARITMHITVFLAMTALHFVISDKLPASSYATGVEELILIGYLVATISVPEAVIVHVLEKMKRAENRRMKVNFDSDSLSVRNEGKEMKEEDISKAYRFWKAFKTSVQPKYASTSAKIIDKVTYYFLLLSMSCCIAVVFSYGNFDEA